MNFDLLVIWFVRVVNLRRCLSFAEAQKLLGRGGQVFHAAVVLVDKLDGLAGVQKAFVVLVWNEKQVKMMNLCMYVKAYRFEGYYLMQRRSVHGFQYAQKWCKKRTIYWLK